MKLIVGLGNPGEKYENTRHNLGFVVLDALLQALTPVEKTVWKESKKFNSLLHRLQGDFSRRSFPKLRGVAQPRMKSLQKDSSIAKISSLILAKPQTFMNASGFAVVKIANFYKINPENIWVVHDDVDLPLEKIRIVKGRGSAGHRGVESIIKELGTTDFVRFRLGIGHPGLGSSDKEVERYVLAPFGKGEKSKARRMVKKAVKAIELALDEGLERIRHQVQP